MKNKIVCLLISVISFGFIAFMILHEPIPQDPAYHNFSDTHTFFNIPNGFNTLSNLPFILVGVFGLLDLKRMPIERYLLAFRTAYALLFLGSVLVGFGSSYYHLNPSNATLIWDRLPMTLAFMSLFTILVAEFSSERVAAYLFWPLLVLGALSVVYWALTESMEMGDLRPYIVVQFLPMLIIPIILLLCRGGFDQVSGYWYLLLCYLLAKATEYFDVQIHDYLGFVSGHSVKHLLAALGLFFLALSYRRRRRAIG